MFVVFKMYSRKLPPLPHETLLTCIVPAIICVNTLPASPHSQAARANQYQLTTDCGFLMCTSVVCEWRHSFIKLLWRVTPHSPAIICTWQHLATLYIYIIHIVNRGQFVCNAHKWEWGALAVVRRKCLCARGNCRFVENCNLLRGRITTHTYEYTQ